MNAAIYVRVSTKGQEDEGTSLDSQDAACRAYAAEHGYMVEERHVYREVHTGAELWERPKLTALREAVRAREVKVIIAHALDRLSREQGHIYILDDECTRHGVALRFVTEEFEQTAVGKVIRSVKAFAAELEREKIRERSVRGKRSLAESGKLHNGGSDLYGYTRDKAARVRVIKESEAIVVRQIFTWVGLERLSLRQIERRLNEDGVPSPSVGEMAYPGEGRTARWARSQLHRLLRNPAYKGEPYPWHWKHSKTNHGLHRPQEEWLRLADDTTPAIVSPELWQAAQDQLATNTGAETRNETRPFLLRGHIYCAICGQRMASDTEHSGMRKARIYRCSSRYNATGACGGARAWEQLAEAIQDPSLISRQWEAARESGPAAVLAEDRAAATRSLDRLRKQQERLVRRLRDADDEIADLIERELGEVERERKALRATIVGIDARLAEHADIAGQLDALVDYCARVGLHLADFDFDRKRLALRAFKIRVEANGAEKVGPWRITGLVPIGEGTGVVSRSSG